MFPIRSHNTGAANTDAALARQIAALELCVLARKNLLRSQAVAVRQSLQQKWAASVNTLLISGVLGVLGYFALRRTSSTASVRAKNAETASSQAPQSASESTNILVKLLRFIAQVLFFFTGVLRFFVFLLDAIGMVKWLLPSSVQPMTNHAPVQQASTTTMASAKVNNPSKRKYWILLVVLAVCFVGVLIIWGWLHISSEI